MAAGNAVWGIDVGQCALKAIKLRPAGDDKVEAVAFDVIEHPKILSQPDANRDELISSALEKFASRNDWQGDDFMIGVPGQQTFARFCKMPPIDLKKDAKKIPELVRYEASQQIPFDMDDVVWDYQVFTSEESPDIEVGIFAIRKDLIRKHLGFFGDVGIAAAGVQTIPASLYNFCLFDGQAPGAGEGVVLIDVGAQNTDLIIVESNAAWTRNIPLGGNSFTEALVRAFKLSFAKAENLKRSAAESKYARQIFQAMRPVFSDLVAEIQRSIGFYSSTHRDIELKQVLALGNAFRLPGLLKYLENNLTVGGGVRRLEKFNNLVATPTINAPQFTDNVLSFAPAYGLAVQGLGLGTIQATLLPKELARIAVWKRKRPFFVATAAALLVAAGIPYVANGLDQQALEASSATSARQTTQRIISEARGFQDDYRQAQTDTTQREEDIKNLLKLQEYKLVLPRLVALVNEAMPPLNPPDLAQVSSPSELAQLIEQDPTRYERTARGQLIVESFKIEYHEDIDDYALRPAEDTGPSGSGMQPPSGGGGFMPGGGGPPRAGGMMAPTPRQPARPPGGPPRGPGGGGGAAQPGGLKGGFVVFLEGRLLYGRSRAEAQQWLTDYQNRLVQQSHRDELGLFIPTAEVSGRNEAITVPLIQPYHRGKTDDKNRFGDKPPGDPGGPPAADTVHPDPVTGEETRYDWRVQFAYKVKFGAWQDPADEATPDDAAAPPQNNPARPGGR
jgi:type IV pilus assembly protein PilM